jgi:hypothetical protein
MSTVRYLMHVCIVLIFSASKAAFAISEKELNEKLNEMAAQEGITDKKQLESLKAQVISIIKTKEHFTYIAIKEPCKEDILRFCPDTNDTSVLLECMKDNRDHVSQNCENTLRNQLGGKPLKEAQLYQGVLVPKGSTFFYDTKGNVLGAIFSENFKYRNIHFKSGQVRFNDVGISYGRLASDQYIDGVKYSADGIGPFFNKNGDIVNATLAENTEISGVLYKAGAQIQFYSKGKVQSGTVAKEVTVQGKTYSPNSAIRFKKSGEIQTF